MADDSTDQSQKTEDPTQKRIDDSRKKGQVANSREVSHWFMILAAAIVVMTFAPAMMSDLSTVFVKFIETPHLISADEAHLRLALVQLLKDVSIAALLPMAVLLAAAFASGVVQNGLLLAPERLKPTFDKISLFAGFKRQFSLKAVAEFVKGILKIVVVGAVVFALVWPEMGRLERMTSYDMVQILDLMYWLTLRVLIGVISIVTIIAGADFLYQKFEHLKSMRMSRQEIKDEYKQSEGDPMIKGRLRQMRMERARRRMMAAVPDASVVITNPTHYSIALKYELNAVGAPKVVAKGIDQIALRIREVAKEHGVPLVENRPLAQALYAGVDIDQEVPEEHYKAVAEIIGYVFRMQGKIKPQNAARPPVR